MAFIQRKPTFRGTAMPRRPQHWSALVRNLGYVCWIFTAFIGIAAGFLAYGQYRTMKSWLSAQGIVTQREIYWNYSRNSRNGRSIVYGARFTFRYNMNGRENFGVADLGIRSGFRSWIANEMERLPVGTQREIRVNPDVPGELSLTVDYGPLSFAASYFATSLALVTFALGLVCWWGAKHWREADERRRAAAATA